MAHVPENPLTDAEWQDITENIGASIADRVDLDVLLRARNEIATAEELMELEPWKENEWRDRVAASRL